MPTYRTVPDELLEYIDVICAHFRGLGFRIDAEPSEIGFPYTPTLRCRRGQITTIFTELDNKVPLARLQEWVRYGRSCGKDTRVALCLPSSVNVSGDIVDKLQQHGIGLYRVLADRLVEQLVSVDLGLNLELPALAGSPARVRQLLGPAYEQFGRAQWREGFELACQALEDEARRYLKRWSHTGRIAILRRTGSVTLTDTQINKFTMGQLANAFQAIQAQNHADSVIGQALSRINRDRVAVAHFRARVATERRLRTNVGQHMWVIIAAFREMI